MRMLLFLLLLAGLGLGACRKPAPKPIAAPAVGPQGKLFIIGGGKRPPALIDSLLQLAAVADSQYLVILPMASEEADSAVFYASKQFAQRGIRHIVGMNFDSIAQMTPQRIDSLRRARLIYITGGDQNKFMRIVHQSPVHQAILQAYHAGATIAGTSAGAAVMSHKMITGNELKNPDDTTQTPHYTGEYRTIRANNIEIGQGLGLVQSLIIDQHFVWRMRMNRLITSCLENPLETLVGIDESTALCIHGQLARVYGQSQVVVLRHTTAETKIQNGLLGAERLELSIYLPGDEFRINEPAAQTKALAVH